MYLDLYNDVHIVYNIDLALLIIYSFILLDLGNTQSETLKSKNLARYKGGGGLRRGTAMK